MFNGLTMICPLVGMFAVFFLAMAFLYYADEWRWGSQPRSDLRIAAAVWSIVIIALAIVVSFLLALCQKAVVR